MKYSHFLEERSTQSDSERVLLHTAHKWSASLNEIVSLSWQWCERSRRVGSYVILSQFIVPRHKRSKQLY